MQAWQLLALAQVVDAMDYEATHPCTFEELWINHTSSLSKTHPFETRIKSSIEKREKVEVSTLATPES
jgi:hypothetical protein